ncbi:MAG: tail fiber domain-containing protein, partial [Methylococcales bacterium]|nr:tail fiber domain-containing protein [Methylococcales bacterium]
LASGYIQCQNLNIGSDHGAKKISAGDIGNLRVGGTITAASSISSTSGTVTGQSMFSRSILTVATKFQCGPQAPGGGLSKNQIIGYCPNTTNGPYFTVGAGYRSAVINNYTPLDAANGHVIKLGLNHRRDHYHGITISPNAGSNDAPVIALTTKGLIQAKFLRVFDREYSEDIIDPVSKAPGRIECYTLIANRTISVSAEAYSTSDQTSISTGSAELSGGKESGGGLVLKRPRLASRRVSSDSEQTVSVSPWALPVKISIHTLPFGLAPKLSGITMTYDTDIKLRLLAESGAVQCTNVWIPITKIGSDSINVSPGYTNVDVGIKLTSAGLVRLDEQAFYTRGTYSWTLRKETYKTMALNTSDGLVFNELSAQLVNGTHNLRRSTVSVASITPAGTATFKILSNVSDRRLKTNIDHIDLGNDYTKLLADVTPRQYTMISDTSDSLTFGFVAQELIDILPNAVSGTGELLPPTEDGGQQVFDYYAINYISLIPVLWKICQGQEEKISSHEEKITTLEQQVAEKDSRLDACEQRLFKLEAAIAAMNA